VRVLFLGRATATSRGIVTAMLLEGGITGVVVLTRHGLQRFAHEEAQRLRTPIEHVRADPGRMGAFAGVVAATQAAATGRIDLVVAVAPTPSDLEIVNAMRKVGVRTAVGRFRPGLRTVDWGSS